MKHRKTGRIFGRVRRQRTALLRTLLGSLVLHGRIVTTEAKAKEMRGYMDRLITKVKRAQAAGNGTYAVVRKIEADLPRVAREKLIADIDRFADRTSGYTRVVKMTARRSDQAAMALIEFVS